jgi:hypothetical protein
LEAKQAYFETTIESSFINLTKEIENSIPSLHLKLMDTIRCNASLNNKWPQYLFKIQVKYNIKNNLKYFGKCAMSMEVALDPSFSQCFVIITQRHLGIAN